MKKVKGKNMIACRHKKEASEDVVLNDETKVKMCSKCAKAFIKGLNEPKKTTLKIPKGSVIEIKDGQITIMKKDSGKVDFNGITIPLRTVKMLEKISGKKLSTGRRKEAEIVVNMMRDETVRKKLQAMGVQNLKDMGLESMADRVEKDNKRL